jgi:hypothetical protein
MFEKPDGADLLATARDAVLHDLLPALPPEHQATARMVAAAIALALREAAAPALPAMTLARLAAEIRAGVHDPGSATHADTAETLCTLARARATVSAPRALP